MNSIIKTINKLKKHINKKEKSKKKIEVAEEKPKPRIIIQLNNNDLFVEF